jgi:farnesyl-diphosphate farnesyltransferase
VVIEQHLPETLRDCVCIFYLVLRGLDSVGRLLTRSHVCYFAMPSVPLSLLFECLTITEDDMTLDDSKKLPLLLDFHNLLYKDGWNIENVGDGPDYRILLANFEKVIRVFKSLSPAYQAAIKDITLRMGKGMADFVEETKTKQGCPTIEKYNLYCHYVAGLVGHGLSALFSASGLEDPKLKDELEISNSMGLFLQKTNIIRDYLEDLDQGRTWWPKQIWGQYATELGEFKQNPTADRSLECLNHMVNDALSHIKDCLKYLSMIKDVKVFEFCAIPQIMAIATLSEVYNNKDVFRRVVKVRKGLSCRMMLECSNIHQVAGWFNMFTDKMIAKMPSKKNDRNQPETAKLLQQTKRVVSAAISESKLAKPVMPQGPLRMASLFAWCMFIVAMAYLIGRYRGRQMDADFTTTPPFRFNAYDYSALVGAFISLAYLFGFFGIHLL